MGDKQNNTEERLRVSLKKRLRRKRIKKAFTWIIILIILGGGYYLYKYYEENQRLPFGPEGEPRSPLMSQSASQEVTVREIEYSKTIDISGHVEAYQTQRVVFRSTGAVTGVFVKEGDFVKEGTLLATIDDTSQSYNLANIESQIEEAKLRGSVRTLGLLEMQLKMAQNNLDYTKAYANFDGVVASVNVDEGDYFEAGTAAMILVDRSKLKATVEIDEIDIQTIFEGMSAELTFDSIGDRVVDAKVDYIPMLGRTTNQGIGVLDVEIVIDDPPTQVSPGFTFAGSIISDDIKSILVVPASAITSNRRGPDTIRKKGSDGNIISINVTSKYIGESMSEITSGDLKAGDIVIVGGNSTSNFSFGAPSTQMRMGF
ncbi:MAG: efflux RND transporter periplasmic adaptor subunit [Sphaerochaetaceae bacterium]|jgi:membrane fusion protein (multidrug efflux system)